MHVISIYKFLLLLTPYPFIYYYFYHCFAHHFPPYYHHRCYSSTLPHSLPWIPFSTDCFAHYHFFAPSLLASPRHERDGSDFTLVQNRKVGFHWLSRLYSREACPWSAAWIWCCNVVYSACFILFFLSLFFNAVNYYLN